LYRCLDYREIFLPLDFDISRAPMMPSDFAKLVQAVVDAPVSGESHWIEWKSTLELGEASGKAHLARCIVGLANRVPAVATATCEGKAYLVVGASPGQADGLDEVDAAVLEARLAPFLGSDGPRWQPHWVTFKGRPVLVIEVAAPAQGDPIHAIRRDGEGVKDGDVYVRRGGATYHANSSELRQLTERANAGATIHGIGVSLVNSDLQPVDLSERAIEHWISGLRDAYMHRLRAHQSAPPQGLRQVDLGKSAGIGRSGRGLTAAELIELERRKEAGEDLTDEQEERLAAASKATRDALNSATRGLLTRVEPETRSTEEYIKEVETYIQECRRALPRVLRLAAAERLTPAAFVLHNGTDENFPDVRLRLHLEGPVEAAEPGRRATNEGRLSPAPRPYGPRRLKLFPEGLGLTPIYRGFNPRPVGLPYSGPDARLRVDIENTGSASLTFSPVHLRPLEREAALAPVVLLASVPPGGEIIASWEVTSTGTKGVAAGELVIPFHGDVWSISDALREDEEEADDE
jgi:hypothetical protein